MIVFMRNSMNGNLKIKSRINMIQKGLYNFQDGLDIIVEICFLICL